MNIMDNKAALPYFKNAGGMLKDDLELLKTNLGISQFGYARLFYNNKYFFLSSDLKVIEDLLSLDDALIAGSDKAMQSQNGYDIIVWPKHPPCPALEIYTKYNHWNGISFLKKSEDYADLFWFTSETRNTSASNFYIKNSKLLIAFVQYWLNKNTERLDLNTPKVLATFVNGIDFSDIDKMELERKAEKDRLKKFLELIRSEGANLHTQTCNTYITSRELECLRLLSQCNTVKEVASSLNISPRTVEGHINNIRSKTGFLYKSDLIKLYKEQIIDLEL